MATSSAITILHTIFLDYPNKLGRFLWWTVVYCKNYLWVPLIATLWHWEWSSLQPRFPPEYGDEERNCDDVRLVLSEFSGQKEPFLNFHIP